MSYELVLNISSSSLKKTKEYIREFKTTIDYSIITVVLMNVPSIYTDRLHRQNGNHYFVCNYQNLCMERWEE